MSLPEKLEETKIYLRLQNMCKNRDNDSDTKSCEKMLKLVSTVRNEIIQDLKSIKSLFKTYTLHDEVHSITIINVMGEILEVSESLNKLSYLEIGILILSAYLHDIGMSKNNKKLSDILESEDFKIVYETKMRIKGLSISDDIEIKDECTKENIEFIKEQIVIDYLRDNHGSLSYEYIVEKWGNDERWYFDHVPIVEIVANVCKSHTKNLKQLINNEKYPNKKLIGNNAVNVLYLSILLRLADILDFDRKRTPLDLYKKIPSNKNKMSILEWKKHRAVHGWFISEKEILYDCESREPLTEISLKRFNDMINLELKSCLDVINDCFSNNVSLKKYKLNLPDVVNFNITSIGYEYSDLSFNLNSEGIMGLLMGTELWGETSLFVRELIQNSYDAIKQRQFLSELHGGNWDDGRIIISQRLNEHDKIEVSFEDNGIGMDKEILEKYFFNVGKSYYRSQEFEELVTKFKRKNIYFNPISYFGIGIMSCFMFGDSLRIRTQRYFGDYHDCGSKLCIEVERIHDSIIIRNITDEDPNPGTKITIIGEKNIDAEFNIYDYVRMYATSLDIPIEVHVEESFKKIDETIFPRERPLVIHNDLENKISNDYLYVYEKNFEEISDFIEGTIRIPFLINDHGKITMKHNGYQLGYTGVMFRDITFPNNKNIQLFRPGDIFGGPEVLNNSGIICHKGILSQDGIMLSYYFNLFGIAICSYFINLFGERKLPLKADRSIYDYKKRGNDNEIKWNDFIVDLRKFESKILKDILINNDLSPEPDEFWLIMLMYNFSFEYIDKSFIYEFFPLPCIINDELRFFTLKELYFNNFEKISFDDTSYGMIYNTVYIPLFDESFDENFNMNYFRDIKPKLRDIISLFTILNIQDNKIIYNISPKLPFENVINSKINPSEDMLSMYYQIYDIELRDYLYVSNSIFGVNYEHPVIKFVMKNQSNEYYSFIKGVDRLIYLINKKNFKFINDFDKLEDDIIHDLQEIVYYWRNVNWDGLNENLKPPYKVFYPETAELIEFSPDFFEEILEKLGYKPEMTVSEFNFDF